MFLANIYYFIFIIKKMKKKVSDQNKVPMVGINTNWVGTNKNKRKRMKWGEKVRFSRFELF